MTRRAPALALAASALAFSVFTPSLFPLAPAFAQTKPKIAIPPEKRSEARALAEQLLREGKIIRSSEVHRGMRGIARSVFQGTKIEEFQVEILGVLSRVQGGGDLILIKVLDGPVVKRNSGIIAGMSGSPVYIHGKMLGAIAAGWNFPKEPIAGVTPIVDMIETSLPDPARGKVARPTVKTGTAKAVAKAPAEAYVPREPMRVAGRKIARVVVSRDRNRLALADSPRGATMTMRPVSTLLQISGFSESALPGLRRAFERYGIEPIIGPASRKTGVKTSLVPGAAIGVQLVSGDMDQTAVGTVTFRMDKRILAFGHPMFGQGSTSLPITTSFVHDIFPAYDRSFKLASPIDVVGALQQDTEFAIGGTIGAVADTIPMTVKLDDPERQINKTYHVRLMKDPILTPMLLTSVATEAIQTSLGQVSDKMVRIGLRMAVDGAQPIVKYNYLYAAGGVAKTALADFADSLLITQENEFARGSIRRVDLTVSLEPVRKTALIKALFADRNRVKAGESVRVSVNLEPSGSPDKTVTRTFTFTVPVDAPTGIMRIAAAPGSAYYDLRSFLGGPPPEPDNLKQLIEAYNRLGASNELQVAASTPDKFLLIDRKKVSNPSPTWSKLVRSSASTSVGAYNETDIRREMTEFSLDGARVLSIPVEGLRDHDKPADAADSTIPTAKPPGPLSVEKTTAATPNGGDTSTGDDGDDSDAGDEANAQFRRADRLYAPVPFLENLKKWRKMASSTGDAVPMQDPPARNAPTPPITPTIGSPTPTPAPPGTPTPTPTPAPSVLPVDGGQGQGRPALSWVQASPTDFLRGTFERAQVSSEGAILLSPPTKLLATTPETFAWSIAGDKAGNVYIGTGNEARILKIDANGAVSTFYDGPEVAVTALTTDAAGNLYAGVSPGGRVYRFAPDGKRTRIFTSKQTFIWDLQWDEGGNLLIATGGEKGKLYRIGHAADAPEMGAPGTTNATEPAPLATVEQNHIRAVAVRGKDIFIGTAGDGVLYRVDAATGAVTALYQVVTTAASALSLAGVDAPRGTTEITSVIAAPEGVYFGTMNSGTIYRWTEENGVASIYPSPQQSVYALRRSADGRIFAATGDKGIVYQVMPAANPGDVRGARILEPTQLQAFALALSPSGDLLVGTGNNAAAYRISLASKSPEATSGSYTSAVFDAKNPVRWGALRSVGNAALETRSGNTSEPDNSWSEWKAVERNDLGEAHIASPPARYLQYRARLNLSAGAGAGADAPSLSRIEVIYRASNLPPTVQFASPKGSEFWNKKKTLSWVGQDPNTDTLSYKLSLSKDDGKTWQPVTLTKDSSASFELDTAKWPDGVYRARIEASDEGRNPDDPMKAERISAPFVIDNTPPKFDAYAVKRAPDGSLAISATATDALAPLTSAEWRFVPAKAGGAAAVTPPAVVPTAVKPLSGPAVKTPKTKGKATPPAAVTKPGATAAEVTPSDVTPTDVAIDDAVEAGDADADETKADAAAKDASGWQSASASDGIFDSRREAINAVIAAEKAAQATGKTIELRVRDAAGNTAVVTLAVP